MKEGLAGRATRALEARRLPLVVALLSVVVALPSLGTGLRLDDLFHRAYLTGDRSWVSVSRTPLTLFTFVSGEPDEARVLLERGLAPWWVSPDLRLAFFRPVSCLSHVADYALFPRSPWLMHAHSLAWNAALVLLVALLFRRLFGDRRALAGLAALIYAVDHTRGLPIGWVANRNALIAGTFAIASLLAHDVGARGARRAGLSLLSALALGLALGSGESAVAILPYLAAHAAFLDERPLRERLASLAPHALVVVAFVVLYRAGRYGVVGSGVYVDAARDPIAFLTSIGEYLPQLVAAELGSPGPDLYPLLPLAGKALLYGVALLTLAWAAAALGALVRSEDLRTRRLARFFLVSSVLAIVPTCATFPSGRLLVVAGLGLVGLVAMVGGALLTAAPWLGAASTRERSRRLRDGAVRSWGIWAASGHVFLSPIALQVTMRQMVVFDDAIARLAKGVPHEPGDETKRLVLVDAPDGSFGYYLLIPWIEAGEPAPRRLLTMGIGTRDLFVTRTAERTLHVEAAEGFYRRGTDVLFRDPRAPMPAGTRVALGDVTVTVTRAGADGIPTEADFEFVHELEGGAYAWRTWRGADLVPWTPPKLGQRVAFEGRLPPLL